MVNKVLTKEEEELEYEECALNPIYFINKFAYAFNILKNKVDKITCFDYQERVINNFLDFSWNIILKSRQTGISVITAAYVAWRLLFGIDETIIIIANNGLGATRFLAHIKQFLNMLPSYLYNPTGDEKAGLSREEVVSNQKKLEIITKGGFKNSVEAKAASAQAGRGDSPTLLVLDEWAFVDVDESIWTSVAAALSMTDGDCIIISTPFGTSNLFHSFWVEAVKKTGSFNPIRVHWTENPFAAKGLKYVTDYKGRQVATSPWYEDMKKKYNHDYVKIAQELDLSFAGSKLLAFDLDDIEKNKHYIQKNNIQPLAFLEPRPELKEIITTKNTGFEIYEMPVEGRKYILGADVAHRGQDYSTIQILDAETMVQVAEFQGKIDPDIFAHWINKAAIFYNYAYVVIEANNHGLATCLELRNRIGYKKMHLSKNVQQMNSKVYEIRFEEGDEIPGFQTNTKTRPLIINAMNAMMRDGGNWIRSQRLISELETFIINSKGKAVADQGYNDDLVLAMCIAIYVRNTEYTQIAESKSQYEEMLKNFSYSKSEMYGKSETDYEKAIRLKNESDMKKDNLTGFYYSGGKSESNEDSDLSWLYD